MVSYILDLGCATTFLYYIPHHRYIRDHLFICTFLILLAGKGACHWLQFVHIGTWSVHKIYKVHIEKGKKCNLVCPCFYSQMCGSFVLRMSTCLSVKTN